MKRISISDFKEKSNIEIIQELIKVNNGYITTKQLEELGLHRMYLTIMKKKKLIEKLSKGIYIDSSKIEDNYYVFSLSMPKVIFSHMTALYFHGLSIKAPNEKYDVTVTKSYNNVRLKKHNVFYVEDNIYTLGIIEVETPMGNKVKVYDIERCICDIIRSRKRMDLEHIKYSIREYLKRKDKDLTKLSLYAEKLNIKEEVMDLINMLYE